MKHALKLTALFAALFVAAVANAITLNLSWDAVPGATGYKVERAIVTGTTINFIEIAANVTGTTYVDTSATAVLTEYRVRAFSGSIVSGYSNVTGWMPEPANAKVVGPAPVATLDFKNGDQYTIKASTNPTRPGSKTINVPPGAALYATNVSSP